MATFTVDLSSCGCCGTCCPHVTLPDQLVVTIVTSLETIEIPLVNTLYEETNIIWDSYGTNGGIEGYYRFACRTVDGQEIAEECAVQLRCEGGEWAMRIYAYSTPGVEQAGVPTLLGCQPFSMSVEPNDRPEQLSCFDFVSIEVSEA
jgi:hypothetical protein